MACINPDGTLSTVARALLELLATRHGAEQAAVALGLPLYRVRATARELTRAGLIAGAADGLVRTPLGREALDLDAEAER